MSEAVDSLKKIQEGLQGELAKIEPSDRVNDEKIAETVKQLNKTRFFATNYKQPTE